MLKSYFKVAFRDAKKNSFFSILNILGLSVSLAACLIIISYVSFELSYDAFHTGADRLYRVAMNVKSGDAESSNAATYPILRNLIVDKFSQVQSCLRVKQKKGIIANESNAKVRFSEDRVYYADRNFFEVFNFELIKGDPATVLNLPNGVVLTEQMVRKYFGAEAKYDDVLGKPLRKIGTTENELLMVAGICRDVPSNSHFVFDFIINYEAIYQWKDQDGGDYRQLSESSTEWPGFYTYILFRNVPDPVVLNETSLAIGKSFASAIPEYQRGSSFRFILQPIQRIHLDSHFGDELMPNGDIRNVYILTSIAVLLLIIAIVNYVNLSSARTSERYKEVGIRKVLGAQRSQIIARFLSESMAFAVVSTSLAIVLMILFWFWIKPYAEFNIDYAFWSDPNFYIFVCVALLLSTVIYSLYPIAMLSSHNPITALRGGVFGIKGGGLRKLLVVFQFIIATVLIAGALVIEQQMMFMKSSDTGLKTSHVLVLRAPKVPRDRGDYLSKNEAFKVDMGKIAAVHGVSLSVRIPGEDLATQVITREDQPEGSGRLISIVGVDHDYIKTLGLKIVAGDDFLRDAKVDDALVQFNQDKVNFGTDDHSVILNESAVKSLGFNSASEAIGNKVFVFGSKKVIRGVVNDYYQKSLKAAVKPTLFYVQLVYGSFYLVNLDSKANVQQILELGGKIWSEYYPMDPFEFFFFDDFYNAQYKSEARFYKIFSIFTILVVSIACLGLFALSMFSISKRSKEIAIRKIAGVSFLDIAKTILYSVLKLSAIAVLVSIPLIFFVSSEWLDSYPHRISLGLWVIAIPALIIMGLTIVIVLSHIWRAVRKNSIYYLRSE
jgi:putative ABC transport system permease protein